MRVGLTLPQFRDDAGLALDVARRAEAAGLHGVFVFDHLWPIGRPDRPALHGTTLAAALAAETERVVVGTLVARVGLLPDDVVVSVFTTLARMTGARLVAGLGVGDALSRAENEAYGVPFAPVDERRRALAAMCRRLRAEGITTWVGGHAEATRAVARAEADALNLWQAHAEAVAAERGVDVTWGGQVDLASVGPPALAGRLRALAAAGATWAVVAPLGVPWPTAVESIAAAAGALVD